MHYLKPDPKPKVNVQLCWISHFESLVGLRLLLVVSYELGVTGEKKVKTAILLIKMDITHFTLVNLESLTV